MTSVANAWLATDPGVLAHWQRAFSIRKALVGSKLVDLLTWPAQKPALVWIDLAGLQSPPWDMECWSNITGKTHLRLIAMSSTPNDDEAIRALDAGCVGYGHAFANAATLKQMSAVIENGQVWIGQSLMHRLLRTVERVAPPSPPAVEWHAGLTPREVEIATLAANATSNAEIAHKCGISERTVKAHLSAIFIKLNLTDRLQLALRVHGIS